MLWIAFAALFLIVLFILKTTPLLKNKETYQSANQENGLTYSNLTIEDSVNKDTDGDGILDWQEGLYGLDPRKKETTPGIPDNVVINKLFAKGEPVSSKKEIESGAENLTQTEKFSRELFATIAATSQNGTMDQAAIEQLSNSLAEKIKNPVIRKVFLTSDVKIIKDDSIQAVKNYFNTMNDVQAKYPIKESVISVLQKFIIDENNVDSSVLVRLDGAISQTQNIINGILKVDVPQSLVSLHLDLLNAGERLLENVSDIQLFDSDPIVAMGGMSKYEENWNLFNSALNALANAINKKLNS